MSPWPSTKLTQGITPKTLFLYQTWVPHVIFQSFGHNSIARLVSSCSLFLVLNCCTFLRVQITIYFENFFHHRPFSFLSLAIEINSTLLIPILLLVFPFNNSSWLARGAVFAIVIDIFLSLDRRGAVVFRKPRNEKNEPFYFTVNKISSYLIKKQVKPQKLTSTHVHPLRYYLRLRIRVLTYDPYLR